MLLLTSLAGCAMNDGDKMALTSSEQSAAPDVAMIESDDNTITFEFGVGMTGPTRVVAVTSSSSIPATSDDDAYLEYLARQKIAEWRQTEQSVRLSSPQLEARRRAARRSRNPAPIRVQVALAKPRRTGLKIHASRRRNRPRAPT